jgi:dTDP-4-amino-4,6-dideoxygalactose transaminase
MKNKPAILGAEPVFKKKIPITEPTIPAVKSLLAMYGSVLKSRMITNSKYVQKFEDKVKKYTGAKYAVALNSCTSGLILIFKSLGLKGEVIVPSFTFYATAHALLWNNLKPVFVDCDPETYNINTNKIESLITLKTSAILGVHIFGNPADVESLEYISKKHKLKLIFDAAHGFGSKYKGRNIGTFGDAEAFSLSPTKLLTAGEGGMVTTNNEELARKLMIGRTYGDSGIYDPEFCGLSARMSEFHAVLGIESLNNLKANVAKRNKLVNLYKSILSEIPGISFQLIKDGNQSNFKDFSVLIDPEKFGLSRDALSLALAKENIVTKNYFYPPLHQQMF